MDFVIAANLQLSRAHEPRHVTARGAIGAGLRPESP